MYIWKEVEHNLKRREKEENVLHKCSGYEMAENIEANNNEHPAITLFCVYKQTNNPSEPYDLCCHCKEQFHPVCAAYQSIAQYIVSLLVPSFLQHKCPGSRLCTDGQYEEEVILWK